MSSTSQGTKPEPSPRELLFELLEIAERQMSALHSEFCCAGDHEGVLSLCEPRLAEIRKLLETCKYGHSVTGENIRMVMIHGREYPACKHCAVCTSRASRVGIPLAKYYEVHPETREYKGFPVAGAQVRGPDRVVGRLNRNSG